MKENPAVATALTVVGLVIAIGAILFQIRSSRPPSAPTKFYFTTDDGATYFADDESLAPPITRDGKVVYRAYVFKGASGKPWVQYLGRYKPAAKAKIEALAQQKGITQQQMVNALGEGVEVKVPLTGDTGWVDMYSTKGMSICEIHVPPDVRQPFEPAYP